MSENEKTMEMEINPYDHLVKEEAIEPAVILQPQEMPEQKMPVPEKATEIVPLTADAIFTKMKTQQLKTIHTSELSIEEDLLVPDTEPDMESIFNIEGAITSCSLQDGMASGQMKLETMYLPGDTHNDRVIIIEASVDFRKDLGPLPATEPQLKCSIKSMDFRIINERKYRISAVIAMTVENVEATEQNIFQGIKNQELETRKETVNFLNFIMKKTKETEISENIPIKDESIRPVKILKSSFVTAENHRQLTKEKLISNESIWVRIIYMAEVASQGNLANNIMYFQGKVDFTQFIVFGEEEVTACRINSDVSSLRAEVNSAGNGFRIEGTARTEAELYNTKEAEVISDFFHRKEEMICDRKEEQVCSGMETKILETDLRETITFQQTSDLPARILYVDGKILESGLNGTSVTGKMQMEVLAVTEENRTVFARKTVDFTMPAQPGELETVFIREMKADIASPGKINVEVLFQGKLRIHEYCSTAFIANPCIVKSEETTTYPIIICTVRDGETLWDIAKKYKVPQEHITAINHIDNISEGMRLVIAK